MPGYEKQTTYVFEVEDEFFTIVKFDDTYFEVEETRNNGQEDCHMAGVAELFKDGTWKWTEESFSRESGQELADTILAYVQTNGLPKDD